MREPMIVRRRRVIRKQKGDHVDPNPAGARAAREFRENGARRRHVLQHAARHQRIDRAVAKRQRIERADDVHGVVVEHIHADDVGVDPVVPAAAVHDERRCGIDVPPYAPGEVERKGWREHAHADAVIRAPQAFFEPSLQTIELVVALRHLNEVNAVVPDRIPGGTRSTRRSIGRVLQIASASRTGQRALQPLKAFRA